MAAKPTSAPTPSVMSNGWLEHAPLPMAMVEGSSHVVRNVNTAFCRLLDIPAEQLVGKPFRGMLPQKDGCADLLDRVYRTGTTESLTEQQYPAPHRVWCYTMWPVITAERPLGVMIQVAATTTVQEQTVAMNSALMLASVRQHEFTEAGRLLNAQLQEEITERKQAEEALHRAQAQLADHAGRLEEQVAERTAELTSTNRQLEAIVNSIAHDLRAPLRAMQGFSTLLVEEAGTGLSETAKGYTARIEKSTQFMDALLSDLLVFSRVSQQRVELTVVSMQKAVEAVLRRLQKDIQDKDARVETSGRWPAVRAHAPTLSQVLFNLTSNALKFVAPGVAPLVRLWAEERAEHVRIWVADNGPGIADEHHDEIFRLFTRLSGGKYQGTGVGLAIVQKGVERMGGHVGVDSASGQGSRFWFELRKA